MKDTITPTLEAFLSSLEQGSIETWLDEQAAECVRIAKEEWPSTAHPENVWATNRSVKTWSILRSQGRRVVVNTSAYSGHVDPGDTRYGGRGSARPWKQRGKRRYTQQIVDRLMDGAADALLVRIRRG